MRTARELPANLLNNRPIINRPIEEFKGSILAVGGTVENEIARFKEYGVANPENAVYLVNISPDEKPDLTADFSNAEELKSLPENRFDIIFMSGVEFNPDKDMEMIKHIHRFLKQDGVFIYFCGNGNFQELHSCFTPTFRKVHALPSKDWNRPWLTDELNRPRERPYPLYAYGCDLIAFKDNATTLQSVAARIPELEHVLRYTINKGKQNPCNSLEEFEKRFEIVNLNDPAKTTLSHFTATISLLPRNLPVKQRKLITNLHTHIQSLTTEINGPHLPLLIDISQASSDILINVFSLDESKYSLPEQLTNYQKLIAKVTALKQTTPPSSPWQKLAGVMLCFLSMATLFICPLSLAIPTTILGNSIGGYLFFNTPKPDPYTVLENKMNGFCYVVEQKRSLR